MKKIAVITGASSGMGKRFAETVDRYGTFDEVWVIARHEAQLEALRATVPFPVRVLALDLTDRGSFDVYAAALAETPVEVGLLMNCSGYGKFSAVLDTPLAVNLNMTDLNCQAVVAMCQITAPYMPRGSQIINIASVAAFQPIPYIDIYGATKSFVLSFSRALNREFEEKLIMAVCRRGFSKIFLPAPVTAVIAVVKLSEITTVILALSLTASSRPVIPLWVKVESPITATAG